MERPNDEFKESSKSLSLFKHFDTFFIFCSWVSSSPSITTNQKNCPLSTSMHSGQSFKCGTWGPWTNDQEGLQTDDSPKSRSSICDFHCKHTPLSQSKGTARTGPFFFLLFKGSDIFMYRMLKQVRNCCGMLTQLIMGLKNPFYSVGPATTLSFWLGNKFSSSPSPLESIWRPILDYYITIKLCTTHNIISTK